MPGKHNNIGQFWQELKRRRVIHVITVYASSAFVLIELVDNLSEPLNLPPNLLTIVVIVLAVGFPLAILLSWLYDLTSEGIEKTKSVEEVKEGKKTVIPNAWKIATYVSFVVIVGLAVLNIVGGGKQLRVGDIQSLVILPFGNFTGDEQLEWLVFGLQASLIQDMGQISGFDVLGKTSSNAYKDAGMTLQDIASERDADALIEADVMCHGDTICFQLRVIRAFPEETTIWSEEYREAKSQIQNLYNRITKQIADEVKIELSPSEEALLDGSRTVDPDAYDAYLKGLYYWEKLDAESIQKSLDYFQLAIDLDPEWADPYAGLANAWGLFGLFEFLPKSVTLPKTYKFLIKAIELDPSSAQAHYVKAINAVWQEWDWEQGEKSFLKSLELNPNDALCRLYYAHLLMILRRTDEAVHQANLGLKRDPLKPLVLGLYGVVMMNEGEYQSAILHFEKALAIDPDFGFAANNLRNVQMDLAYMNGDYEKWFELWGEKATGQWNDEGRDAVINTYHEKGHIAGIEEMFKMTEKYEDCWMGDERKAQRYLKLGDYDKAMESLETAYEMRKMDIAYISRNKYSSHLKDNPRYMELLKKMNLPLPEN